MRACVGFSSSKPSRGKKAWSFAVSKGAEASPHSGREEEAPRTLFVEGATLAPGICPQPNTSEWSRWSAKGVFAGMPDTDAHPNGKPWLN